MILELIVYSLVIFWIGSYFDFSRRWPSNHFLGQHYLGGPKSSGQPAEPTSKNDDSHSLPRVVAIVPARDEAETIQACLKSLFLQKTFGQFEFQVVLVDDSSSDGTSKLARELHDSLTADLEGDLPPFHILHNTPTPEGWAGKVWAMASGVNETQNLRLNADWFLFTDADISHRDTSVASLLQLALAEDRDLVSIMARLNATSFWERLLIPPFVYFFQLLYPFRKVSDDRSKVHAAAGGCVLLRREALEASGGLESIRQALIDDVSLAKSVGREGGKLWLGFDPDIVSLRPYPHLSQIWNMVARSAFVQLKYRYEFLAGTLLAIAYAYCLWPLLLGISILGKGFNWETPPLLESWWILIGASTLVGILQALLLLPSVKHHRVPIYYSLTLPLGAFLYGLMTFSSAWRHFRGKGSQWKNREFTQV